MSKAIQAVIAVAEIAVGAFTGQGWLVAAGISTLLNVAVSLLLSPRRAPLNPIDVNYSGTLEPRRIIYGKLKIGGMHCAPPLTSGSNNDYLHTVIALAGHAISGFGDMYLGQVKIANGDIGAVTGTSNDGKVTNAITNNGYQNKVWIRRYDGTQTTVDYILNTTFSQWDSNHVGHGVPYWAVQMQYDSGIFASGVPEVTGYVLGKKVYDPRLDSTNGGSGSQRYNTPSTWTYSTNAALCLRDFLTSSLGLGEAQTRIDDTLVAAAANICDEAVSVPIPVLVGLTQWTFLSVNVGGVNTAFLSQLNNGSFTQVGANFIPTSTTYIMAPNGSMLQVSSVQSDTQLTLTAGYTGTTATNQVTQWNNSTATTTTQNRYTCNVVLDATARYEENVATLARAMMGQCVYSAGKWRMYAGAWSGSAFSLSEADLVGNVSVQCSTPRQSLYNAVRGNYISPGKNYTPDEFPAILNSSFETADGERIYTETNFPCCTDIFEAQRNAIILSEVSRDQQIVTAQFGMSAYGVKVFETGTVTIAEIGWINQTVRCIGWQFNPRGIIQLTLQVAYAADWTDPLVSQYAVSGVNVGPIPGQYLPYPPTGLTTTSVAGGIDFVITLPSQVAPGTTVEVWEYTANTPFSSATLIWFGTSTKFTLYKTDIVTRYYWARTRGPNNQTSPTYPATNGVAGSALSPYTKVWTPFVTTGSATVSDANAVKSGGSATTWDGQLRSVNGYGTCHLAWKVNTISGTNRVMLGISDSPTSDTGGASLTFGGNNISWYADIGGSGKWQIYQNGVQQTGSWQVAIAVSDVVQIVYDGSTVTCLLNGASVHTASVPNDTFFADGWFYDQGAGVNSLAWGPTTNLKVNDTAEIGLNAATAVYTSNASSVVVPEDNNFHSITSVSVGPFPFDVTIVWTASGTYSYSGSLQTIFYYSLTPGLSGYTSVAETVSNGANGVLSTEFSTLLSAGSSQTFGVSARIPGTGADTVTISSALKVEVVKR